MKLKVQIEVVRVKKNGPPGLQLHQRWRCIRAPSIRHLLIRRLKLENYPHGI